VAKTRSFPQDTVVVVIKYGVGTDVITCNALAGCYGVCQVYLIVLAAGGIPVGLKCVCMHGYYLLVHVRFQDFFDIPTPSPYSFSAKHRT